MRVLGWIVGVVALLAVAFFVFAPGIAERGMNRVVGGPWPVSARAAALHQTLAIADMHADTLLWQRDFADRATRGHVDLPRLGDGNVALQVLSSVTKTPKGQNYESNGADTDNITLLAIGQLQPVRTWFGPNVAPANARCGMPRSCAATRRPPAAGGCGSFVRAAADLDHVCSPTVPPWQPGDRRAAVGRGGAKPRGAGGQPRTGSDAAGFRMIGLAHFFDNELAGSMHGLKKGGLTPFGATIVADMEKRGMIVDLAHCSHACFADVMRVATRPVVVSHGGVKATCNTNRNLSDDELRALARNGGVIGIGYWDAAVCAPTPAATAKAIRHAVDIMGLDHVGLGSDFDGSVTTGFDAAHLAAVTQALLDAGFDDGQVRAIMGGNVLRVLRAGLVPA